MSVSISELFTAYNLANRFTRLGSLDEKRLRKAFGLAQSPAKATTKFQQYSTTIHSCRCPDMFHHGAPCKHMLAKQLLQVANGLSAQDLGAETFARIEANTQAQEEWSR